ncbi:MAG TPA: DUF4013 domain-containing protein [Anaerolineales bacterium]|nr:DUF4013 domain-containing protein [Anaerolineales bacterium]
MTNLQEILLFPVRDSESRSQFLIACAIMLAAFLVPILPSLILMGYSARIMRQIIEQKKGPSMPVWQGSDWSEMLMDGVRLYGAQIVLMLPLFLLMGCGMVFVISGTIAIPVLAEESTSSLGLVGVLFMVIGTFIMGMFVLLSMPYSIIISAALPHVAVQRSFQAAFQFREWFSIFRKAVGQFILGYAVILIASFVFMFVIQFAMLTIVLMCIVPLLMAPYMAYQILIMNSVYAQAYRVGKDALQTA